MKHKIMFIMQKLFGLQRYYFLFALYKIKTLRWGGQKREYHYFVSTIKEHENILLAGGFIGITSVPIAQKCINGKLVVIEPVKMNFEVLNKVLQYFKIKNTITLNAALGLEEQKMAMRTPVYNGAVYNGESFSGHLHYDFVVDYIENETQVVKGDRILEQHHIKLDAIKLVAENFEFDIFNGLELCLKRDKPRIYTELWDVENRNRIFQYLKNLNYKVEVLNENNQLVAFDENKYKDRYFFLSCS
jgi:FkbM family methyltransferase